MSEVTKNVKDVKDVNGDSKDDDVNQDKINDIVVESIAVYNRFVATDNEVANVIANLLVQLSIRCEKKSDMYRVIDAIAMNAKNALADINTTLPTSTDIIN